VLHNYRALCDLKNSHDCHLVVLYPLQPEWASTRK